jgi:hypothetical protein
MERKNYRPKIQEPCFGCDKWKTNTPLKFECTENCRAWEDYKENEKSCWTCGYHLIGGGCYLDGTDKPPVVIDLEYVCNSWIKEGTKGTITDF